MNKKRTILAVDDESMNQIIIKEMLEDNFELICADDGESCLQLMNERLPDLILLDVNMPGLNGLDVCKKIRNNPDNINIPVIFVSALANPDERLKGYAAGGDDYVTKPFVEQELIKKISLLLENQDEKKILKQNSDETMSALMTSLTSSGELGVVINFLRDSYASQSLNDLTLLAFNALKQFNLAGSIMILGFGDPFYFFSDGKTRPLERDILFYLSNKEHIISFGDRTLFNSGNLTLLIRNMPNDEDKSGRYRDHLAMFADGFDARIKGIKNEQEMHERRRMLADVIQTTQTQLQLIDNQHYAQRVKHAQLLSDMIKNIEESFIHLGLSETQEQKLIQLVSKVEKETDSLYEEGLQTDDEFNQIMEKLNISLSI